MTVNVKSANQSNHGKRGCLHQQQQLRSVATQGHPESRVARSDSEKFTYILARATLPGEKP
jgi:hypothetical protein